MHSWARRGAVGIAVTAVAVTLAGGASHLHQGEPHHPAALTAAVSRHEARQQASRSRTTRTFRLGPGRATRTFTLREGAGVILLNQLTVRRGVRAFVVARIPHLAGTKVWSWESRNNPAGSCRRHGAVSICAQSEEWCPMPQATWHFRLVKLSGPAGLIRFDYVVSSPPKR